MSTASRSRTDGTIGVLPIAVALLGVGAIVDVALGSSFLVVPLFVLAPLFVAVRGAPAAETALVAGAAIVLAIVAGVADGETGSTGWIVALASVTGGGLAAVGAATARSRFQRDAERLELLVALSDVVPAATVEATAERLTELLVPAVADACVIDCPAGEERPALLVVRVDERLGPGAEDAVRSAPPPLGPAGDVDPQPAAGRRRR